MGATDPSQAPGVEPVAAAPVAAFAAADALALVSLPAAEQAMTTSSDCAILLPWPAAHELVHACSCCLRHAVLLCRTWSLELDLCLWSPQKLLPANRAKSRRV